MSDRLGLSPALEYQTLREELNQSRKYVFERPLLIVGVGVAVMTTEGGEYAGVLPMLLVGLLLFNYLFTVNRLRSACRIVAYIQVVLEGDVDVRWRGWETSLREYRMWLNEDPEKKKEIVDREMEKKAVPDALMYYAPIYQIHIALVGLSAIASVILSAEQPRISNVVSTILLFALAIVFGYYCIKWRPRKMRDLIERKVVIWRRALGIHHD